MKKPIIFLFLIAVFFQTPLIALAGNNIAGLGFEYPYSFQANLARTQQVISNTPENIKAIIRSFEFFEATPTNGLTEISLIKAVYVMEIQPNIDSATNESVQNIARLDGIENFKQSSKSLTVSGHEARQVSFEANRYGGKLGGEFLIILDRRTNTAWQLQLLFGKKKGINPFASLNIDTERSFAISLLNSVTIQ